MSKTAERPRDGSLRGAVAFFCPQRREYGHLDRNGEFVAHACPEGFTRNKKGELVRAPAAPQQKES